MPGGNGMSLISFFVEAFQHGRYEGNRSRALKQGLEPRDDCYESLCHNHRCGLWPAHLRTYLACLRRRPTPGDEPLVRSHHHCCRRSVSLGLALAQALVAFVTHTSLPPSGGQLDAPEYAWHSGAVHRHSSARLTTWKGIARFRASVALPMPTHLFYLSMSDEINERKDRGCE